MSYKNVRNPLGVFRGGGFDDTQGNGLEADSTLRPVMLCDDLRDGWNQSPTPYALFRAVSPAIVGNFSYVWLGAPSQYEAVVHWVTLETSNTLIGVVPPSGTVGILAPILLSQWYNADPADSKPLDPPRAFISDDPVALAGAEVAGPTVGATLAVDRHDGLVRVPPGFFMFLRGSATNSQLVASVKANLRGPAQNLNPNQ